MALPIPRKTWLLAGLGLGVITAGAIFTLSTLNTAHERELAALPLKERGTLLLQEVGCTDCHQPGSAFRAPILTGLFGKEVILQGGTKVVADAAYLRRSIVNPKADIVQGYQPVMPSYQERLTPEAIEALIEAMK